MKPRLVVPAFCTLSFAALLSFAKEPRWYTQPGTPVRLESSGFVLQAKLPQGWTFTADHGIAPSPAFASSCRVRGPFYTGRDWDRFLVSKLRWTERAAAVEGARMVMKIGGHPAVSNRYVRGTSTVLDIYVNLSDLQPDSVAVWTFEGNSSAEGSDCELQFIAMINSASITHRQ